MRVLIATDTYYPHVNGASYFTQRLAHFLHQRGHAVLVIAPARRFGYEDYTHNDIRIIGTPSLPSPFPNDFRFSLPSRRQRMREVIKEFSPDVVHIQSHFFLCRMVLKIAQELGLPTVGTNHFMPENLVHYVPISAGMQRRLGAWTWRDFYRIFKQLDVVTTPTPTAAHLLNSIGFSDVEALSCGINRTLFHPRPEEDAELAAAYDLGARPRLLYVGRLDHEKHVDIVLRALAEIPPAERPQFLIAGHGAEAKNLHELASHLGLEGTVRFLGFVPNEILPRLYTAADCFVIAGTAELQSLVTMEAMASGLPVLAANAMALPELVHTGENGYLFDIAQPAQLAGYIRELMADANKRHRMGEASLRLVEKHDSAQVVEQYERVYQRAISLAARQAQP